MSQNITLWDKQVELIEDETHSEILLSSGYGAGKTTALATKLYLRARIPGAREGLCGKWLNALKSTALLTLLKGDGNNPPVLRPGTYEHQPSKRTIILLDDDGGELGHILYFGLDDPFKLGGFNLTGCAVDEAANLDKEDWDMITGRTRVRVDGLSKIQIYAATNPRHPHHWLAKRFGIDGSTPVEGSRVIYLNSLENPFLSEEGKRFLRLKSGVDYQRNVLGQWVAGEGLIYDNFQDSMIRDCPFKPERAWVGCDDGGTEDSPFVLLRILMNGKQLHIERELVRKNLRVNETKANHAKRMMASTGTEDNPTPLAETVVCDSAATSLIPFMKASGLSVRAVKKYNNSVMPSVQLVRDRIDSGNLTVSPECVETIKEFRSWGFKVNQRGTTEVPEERNDHLMDALRYVVMTLDGGRGFKVWFANEPETAKPGEIVQPKRRTDLEILKDERLWGSPSRFGGGFRRF